MRIDILTLFPDSFSYLNESIIQRAQEKGIATINIINIRDFSNDKHKKCDDYSFGGGAGMLMTPQPIYDAIKSVQKEKSKIILTTPSGRTFNNNIAKLYSKEEHLIFICGHYEGIDARICEIFSPDELSIGDYVLSGGELPAMVMIDCILRQVEGVISKESLTCESFEDNILEYPQYTRPYDFLGHKVPDVLLRKEMAVEKTNKVRPDLKSN